MNNSNRNTYFPALTGVRAIAAYMVFIHHTNPFTADKFGSTLNLFAEELETGVALFFVLSGFLITLKYFEKPNFNFKEYMVNRVARTYPMYFILTTVTFIVLYLQHDTNVNDIPRYIANITFLKGYFETISGSGIAQGWSLTVEETFYLIAPLLFLLIKKNRSFLFIAPVMLMLTGIVLVKIFSGKNIYGFFGSYEFMFNRTLPGRCFEFFTGIALALFYKKYNKPLASGYITYAGVVMIILCTYFISTFKAPDVGYGIETSTGKLINTFIMPLCGIAVLYYGLLTEKTLISKILKSKPFIIAGKSSYIFYLIHMGVFKKLLDQSFNFIETFILLSTLSILMFSYIEQPLNIFIRKRFTGVLPLKNEEIKPAL